MVKFLKLKRAVVVLNSRFAGVLNSRFAGRKAIIIKQFYDSTRDRRYGHCLVAGISKYPKKVIHKDSAKKTAKKSRMKAFIKLSRDKKMIAYKEAKARLEERFKTGKNRCFFSKLSNHDATTHGGDKWSNGIGADNLNNGTIFGGVVDTQNEEENGLFIMNTGSQDGSDHWAWH